MGARTRTQRTLLFGWVGSDIRVTIYSYDIGACNDGHSICSVAICTNLRPFHSAQHHPTPPSNTRQTKSKHHQRPSHQLTTSVPSCPRVVGLLTIHRPVTLQHNFVRIVKGEERTHRHGAYHYASKCWKASAGRKQCKMRECIDTHR